MNDIETGSSTTNTVLQLNRRQLWPQTMKASNIDTSAIMPPSLWSEDDLISVMAWLDFCKAQGIDFYETIVGHLADTNPTDCGTKTPFTKRQVRTKLTHLIRQAKQSYDHSTAMSVGSGYFKSLSTDIRNKIKIQLQRYTAKARSTPYPMPSIASPSQATTAGQNSGGGKEQALVSDGGVSVPDLRSQALLTK